MRLFIKMIFYSPCFLMDVSQMLFYLPYRLCKKNKFGFIWFSLFMFVVLSFLLDWISSLL